MSNIRGKEFHGIIKNIFGEVKGLYVDEQIQCECPLCAEENGGHSDGKFNLEINTAKKLFRCWRCSSPEFSGSLGRLIRMFGTSADYQIYKSYSATFGSYSHEDDEFEDYEYKVISLPKHMILFANMDVSNPAHFEAYNYMVTDRKIDRSILIKYKIGFCVEGYYRNRIIIPSYDRFGNVNYFVARTFDKTEKKKKYLNPKVDKNKIIFNEGFINWDSTVYLVEGAFEFLTFPVNIIPLLGKNVFDLLLRKLKEHKPNVVIVLDPDAYKRSVELYFEISSVYAGYEDRIKLVKLPNNDDLDEVRKKFGVEEVIKQLYSARYLTVEDYFMTKLENEPQQYRRRSTYNKSY